MKKTTIALAIAFAGVATAAQAAPNDNTWYTGAKLGWSNYHDTKFDNSDVRGKRNQLGAGAYLGYQANPYIGFELGYDWLGRMKYNDTNNSFKAQGIQLAAKLSYPVTNDLDVYTRLGGMTTFSRAESIDGREKKTGISPLFAGGVEYAITPAIATRLDYQWVPNLGNHEDLHVRPDNGLLSVGVAYRFGQGAAIPIVAPIIVPEVETKRFALKSDVLFNFNKATLKPAGKEALEEMYEQLQNINPTTGSIVVIGHTDRIGSVEYNQKLSEERAESIVKFLVAKGIPADRISSRGMGKSESVTGSTCDNVKPRAELIECLAPDRRVDIDVSGTLDVLTEMVKETAAQF